MKCHKQKRKEKVKQKGNDINNHHKSKYNRWSLKQKLTQAHIPHKHRQLNKSKVKISSISDRKNET